MSWQYLVHLHEADEVYLNVMEDIMFKKTLLFIAALLVSFSAFAVNVNTATGKEISTALKGVGESKANAIVMYRENIEFEVE